MHFIDRMKRDVRKANKHSDPKKLTEQQKLAICFLQGMPISILPDKLEPRHPVRFLVIDGEWTIEAIGEVNK